MAEKHIVKQLGGEYKRKPGFSRESRLTDIFKFGDNSNEDLSDNLSGVSELPDFSRVGVPKWDGKIKKIEKGFSIKNGHRASRDLKERYSDDLRRVNVRSTPKSYKSTPMAQHGIFQKADFFSPGALRNGIKNIGSFKAKDRTPNNLFFGDRIGLKRHAKTDQIKHVSKLNYPPSKL